MFTTQDLVSSTTGFTNEEIQNKFPTQLENDKPFIFALQKSKNDDIVIIHFAQKMDTTDPDDLTALFLGWSGTIVRTRQSISIKNAKNVASALGSPIELGSQFKNLGIQIVENTSQEIGILKDGTPYEQSAKQYGANSEFANQTMVRKSDGLPVYRHTQLKKISKVNNILIPTDECIGQEAYVASLTAQAVAQ